MYHRRSHAVSSSENKNEQNKLNYPNTFVNSDVVMKIIDANQDTGFPHYSWGLRSWKNIKIKTVVFSFQPKF